MERIRWTEAALGWLEEIHSHIAQDNPAAARRVVDGIYEKIQLLAEFPELGYRFQHRYGENIRILLYGHYRIAYLIKTDQVVEILGIYHGALDIERYLPAPD